MTHDVAACPLCRRLALGQTHLQHGNIEITPLCATCERHHLPSYSCPALRTDKRICPRCRVNKRALVDIPESGRWEHKTYGRWCPDCYIAEGWQQVTHVVTIRGPRLSTYTATWYEKPGVKTTSALMSCLPSRGAV